MLARLASVQMTSTHDVEENLKVAKELMTRAKKANADLVVLPEMFAMMGLDQMDKVKHREDFGSGVIQDFLSQFARENKIWIVGGTIPISIPGDDHRIRAACLVYNAEGECVARYDKIHLFDVNLRKTAEAYAESKNVEPGGEVVVVETPFGIMGLAVCYDLRFPELFRHMQARHAEFIVVPTAFTYTTGIAHWDILVRARALENLAYVITSCQTGVHPNGRNTYGHSMLVNPWGEVTATLSDEVGVLVCDIDFEYQKKLREDFPVLLHRKL